MHISLRLLFIYSLQFILKLSPLDQCKVAQIISLNLYLSFLIQMSQVLCKMGKFFNQMAQQCIIQLSSNDNQRYTNRMMINNQKIKSFQINKKLEKLKFEQKYKNKRREQAIALIKSKKPKHPQSSFFIYYRQKGQQLAQQHGEVVGSKIAKFVGKLWDNMPKQQKQPYEIKAFQSRKKYQQDMIRYKLQHAQQIEKLKKYKKQQKEKKQIKSKRMKEQRKIQKNIELKQSKEKSFSLSDDSLQIQDDMSDSLENSQNDSHEDNDIERKDYKIEGVDMVQDQIFEKQMNENSINFEIQSEEMQIKLEESKQNYLEAVKEEKYMKQSLKKVQEDKYMKQASKKIQEYKQLMPKHNQKQSTPQAKIPQKINKKQQQINLKNDNFIINSPQYKPIKIPEQKKQILRPKGPVSSFVIFYKTQGKRIAEQNNIAMGPKAVAFTSNIWKRMTPNERQKYQKQSQKTRIKYHSEMQQIRRIHGDDIFDIRRWRNVGKQRKNKKKNER